jgi:pimeloyl-ACP methyl ester carboxylesterase
VRWIVGSALAFAAMLVGCSPSSVPEPLADPAPCPSDIELVVLTPHDCGYLVVPEDRDDPQGPTIRLFYLHVEPAGGVVERDPIASVGYEIAQEPHYASIVSVGQGTGRELYLLDQRGTGHSEPSLACPEVDEVASEMLGEPLTPATEVFRGAVSECAERLRAAGVDLAAYDLAEAGEDLEDLRRAVAVPSWNLISYGSASRVLLEDARRHPGGIRSLVLDSPQFPQRNPISAAPDGYRTSWSALVAACQRDRVCARTYPDLDRALTEAAVQLDRSPRMSRSEGTAVIVDGAALQRVVRHLLSFHELRAWGSIPSIVYDALDGDVRTVAQQLAADPGMCIGYIPRCIHPRSVGAYLSFTCPDVLSAVGALPEGTFGSGDPYVAACDAWAVEASSGASPALSTQVPVLVLRGEYDSFSPLDLVEQTPATMPNAHVILAPFLGNDVFGTYDCMRESRNRWWQDPSGEPDFTACIDSIPPPTFEV